MEIIETFSSEETYLFGKQIGENASPNAVYALGGDLGAGKTVFAQGLAAGLGIKDPVSSPTFTILQIYDGGRLPFYHFDVYRISDVEEMDEIGYDDFFFGGGVSLVEWAELVEEILPEETVYINIGKDPDRGFDYRKITVRNSEERL
ncbi:MAG: tRNA (adenosine(37)-N6)-threonylcarbamoyltransferase complex ATPase subunit type 1 TsaE [Lachnospiraceae bacterium]|nr:tRNA (adenosine(37)-N6)-threonylcarbamoyltransferase complex ATPase subunit type 1 TsaE [Lachnospiraceae bacterium]